MAYAKTTRPRLNGTYPRRRLFRILDRSRKHPATWLCGPPGAGKTTLVASYIQARRLHDLWYHLDHGDNDVAAFFEYLYSAAPLGSSPLFPFNPECLQEIAAFSRKFFRDFYRRLKTPFLVVFGNYHEVPAGSLLHEVIREAVEEVSRGGHVIFTSRTSPPPQLARLRANQMMTVVDGSELRLTLSEAQGLVCSVLRKSLPKKMIARIHNIVDGWAAGLILILERIKTGEKLLEPPNDQLRETVFDYFASEIFARTDRESQDVLLRTAFLPRFSAEMAERLTGNPRAAATLDSLSQDHSFTSKHNGGAPVYQYHPLFRDFLMNEAQKTLPTEDRLEIQQLSAIILAEQGQTEDALALLRNAGSWESLAGLETVPIAQWPWPIKIFTLGRFSLLQGDRPVKFSRKSQRRSLEFLKLLISLGGRNVSEEDLVDALWPDAEGDAAHGALSITVHRLRRLLGHKEALQRQDGKLTLDSRFFWVDLWALERLLSRAEKAVQSQKDGELRSEASRLIEKAVSLYHGPFLSGDDFPSATAMNNRVRRRVLWAVTELGKHWETTGQWENAVHCYEKALQVNPSAEPFYQRLMICQQRLGDRGGGLATYEQCKRTLAIMLGIEPSQKTEGIYNSLRERVHLLAILLATDNLTLCLTPIVEGSL